MTPDAPSERALAGLPEWHLVQRIIKNSGFARSPRLTALLLYLVERKLEGRVDELSETLIAVHVFERPTDYNTAEDSIYVPTPGCSGKSWKLTSKGKAPRSR